MLGILCKKYTKYSLLDDFQEKKQISEPPSFKCQTFVASSLNQCLMPVEGDTTLMDEMSSCGAFTSTGVCVWGVPQTTHRCGCPGVPESTWRECLRNVPTPSRAGHYKEGRLRPKSPHITHRHSGRHCFADCLAIIIISHRKIVTVPYWHIIMLTLKDQFIFQSVLVNLRAKA